jgi:superfamily I DNA/RNA helicase
MGDRASQGMALCSHIREIQADDDVRFGDMAVLTPTNDTALSWQKTLTQNGIPAILLRDYDGTPGDQVKVGTFHRAKGLEFAFVFVPDRDQFPKPQQPSESDDTYRERAELERRQLFVAVTRARDGLWLGTRGDLTRI